MSEARYQDRIKKHAAGETSCPVCEKSLLAHETWPGARYWTCGGPECNAITQRSKTGRYIGANEHKCEGPGCDNFVPATLYDRHADFLTCSTQCWLRRRTKGNQLMTCGCCGEQFRGNSQRKPVGGLYFLSAEHYGRYLRRNYLDENLGALKAIVLEYLDGFVQLHYRSPATVPTNLVPFFGFLKANKITSLEDVIPRTITEYLVSSVKTNQRWRTGTVPFISTFFKWAIAHGYRKAGNPVVTLIHSTRTQTRLPRPLDSAEVDLMWQLLHERGNARLRLAAALGVEAGLRIGEMCRLRVGDLDLKKQTVIVGLPNKSNCPRVGFFSDLTVRYYQEWLAERNPDCGHGYLLHNSCGRPLGVASFIGELKRVLCKVYKGKKLHDTGFDTWSTHRLRHTMASNLVAAGASAATIMATGGWKSFEAMSGYAQVNVDVARRGYDEATKQARKQRHTSTRKVLSLSEFLKRKNGPSK